MKRCLVFAIVSLVSLPVLAQEDKEGCKDHPLFNRMPNYVISNCENVQFDLKRFPVGPTKPNSDGEPRSKTVDVEGEYYFLSYGLNEGVKPPSPMQTMRNFEAAAKKAGGTIEGQYPDWCKTMLDDSMHDGNNCILWGLTMKFKKGGKEVWAFMESEDDGAYTLRIVEKKAMSQDIVATALLDSLNKDGFIALYLNFETSKATIEASSLSQVDEIAKMLKDNPTLKLEVAGHTDNQGNEKSNLKLSEQRAQAVAKALAQRGVAAARLTPKGYGQSTPLSDNRTEEGRAKNRRVELVKKK